MGKPSFKEKFKYWFDNRMSRGTVGLIRLLTIFTVAAILIIALVGYIFNFYEEGFVAVLWDSVATVINAWLPYYEDGEGSIAYLIVMTIAAVCGLLVTSILIGIFSNAIEEKIDSLKLGNSKVLESNHYVILGFTPGEYSLIQQLVLAESDQPACFVIGGGTEREEMESLIRDNVDIPNRTKIICRNIDIFDPVSISRLSPETSHSVIVSPMDDKSTVKALLAVSKSLKEYENSKVQIKAIVSDKEYRFPKYMHEKHNIITFHTQDVIAKIIAHSCTQPGLSETFKEIFNFEGSELYDVELPEAVGKTFEELMVSVSDAVPLGIIRNGKTMLNPDPETVIEKTDRIVVFAEYRNTIDFKPVSDPEPLPEKYRIPHEPQPVSKILILGYNDSFRTVVRELPGNVTGITAEAKAEHRDSIRAVSESQNKIKISIYNKDINEDGEFLNLVKESSHVVLLSDCDLNDDDADVKIMLRILKLRDIRERYKLSFNITAEMRKENNVNLIQNEDSIDFVVSTNMSSLILSQLAENPNLADAISELLSSKGNEFLIKHAGQIHCYGENSVLQIRRIAMCQNYIFMGYIPEGSTESVFNPAIDTVLNLSKEDRLIVVGLD